MKASEAVALVLSHSELDELVVLLAIAARVDEVSDLRVTKWLHECDLLEIYEASAALNPARKP